MRENAIRSIWRDGGVVVNGWLHIPNAYSAEVMAHQGWDSLTIDLQHGPIDYQAAVSMLQAISTTQTVPFARVPWNEPGIVMKMLDAGCYGIICPMVNSRAEAEAFVGACHYPPDGYRSIGPNRALLYGGTDYVRQANETVIAMAMIETAQAVQSIDEILSAPGLDAIYVGPSDLSQSLGLSPALDLSRPRFAEAIDTILAAVQRHGIVAGIHTGSADQALQMIEKGFRFVTILSEARIMAAASAEIVATVKGQVREQEAGPAGPY